MKRRDLVGWSGAVLTIACITHFAIVLLLPYAVTHFLRRRLIESAGLNSLHHAHRPTARNREVAMPSPDLVYSVGAFDVSEHPLHITAPVTGNYMSLSLYASNLDNFFVQNDPQVSGGKFDVVLIGPDAADPHLGAAHVVRAPATTGIMMFRFFAGTGAAAGQIEAARRRLRCAPVE